MAKKVKSDILSVFDQIRAKWVRQYGKEQAASLEVSLMPLLLECENTGCQCPIKYLHC